MLSNELNFIPFSIKYIDKIILIVLFFCSAIIPLFPKYNWLSTMIFLPGIAVLLYLDAKSSKIYADQFLKRMFLVFLFAVISIVPTISLPVYFDEVKQLLGVVVFMFIGTYLLRRNINNIWPLYVILVSIFVIMAFKTYRSDVILNFNMESGRFQSGVEVGINANTYGYYAFIALFALGMIMNTYLRKNLVLVFVIILFVSIYLNVLTASRAGLSMTIFSAILIYLSLTFRSWSNLIIKLLISIMVLFFLILRAPDIFGDLFIVKRFLAFTETGEDSRLTILKEGISLVMAHPLGVGAGHFQIYMANSPIVGKYAASHNSFLLVAANYGVFGLIIYLSIFLQFIRNSIGLFKSHSLMIHRYSLMFLSYGILFLIYNFFYDMILNLYIMLMFFLLNYHMQSIKTGNVPVLVKLTKNEYSVY